MKKMCGARTREGKTCRRAPAEGRSRCRLHGGAAPAAGPSHPRFKHGRYSKAVPRSLRESVSEAEQDADLMSLRSEIALVQGMISERLSRIRKSPNSLLIELSELAETATRREDEGDEAAFRLTCRELIDLALNAGKVSELFGEVEDLVLTKTRVVKEEWRRLSDLGQMISAERAYALILAVVDIIRDEVPDRSTVKKVGARIGALISSPGVQPAAAE